MAQLEFRLVSPRLRFDATEKTDEWSCCLTGECVSTHVHPKFTIVCGDNSFDGFRTEALLVWIKVRPPRTEVPGIPDNKPFDKDDEHRDIIRVHCPNSKGDEPWFEITISLPSDAYQRVIDTDWTRQSISLFVETTIWGEAQSWHDDIKWLADKCAYAYLKKTSLFITSAPAQKNSP